MRSKSPTIQPSGVWLLWAVIGLEISLGLIYLWGIVVRGKAYPLFNMDGQMTIPSLIQALQLLMIGLIALSLLLFQRHTSLPPSRLFCGAIAVLFSYGAVDEVFKFHLQLSRLLNTSDHKDWMPIYLGIGVSTLVIFHRDFIAIWRFYPKAIAFVALGMGIFFLGGFCGEVVKIVVFQLNQGGLIPVVVEKVRVAVEETSELVGESLTIYGLCLFVAKRWDVLKAKH
ncbi:hypothetical protein [Coleofasciculus sp.]|uniref:hypothetical protein n=1 Tax=Coleofasciculus sp. TaxID=3100458 RepID=UPI0039F85EF2